MTSTIIYNYLPSPQFISNDSIVTNNTTYIAFPLFVMWSNTEQNGSRIFELEMGLVTQTFD